MVAIFLWKRYYSLTTVSNSQRTASVILWVFCLIVFISVGNDCHSLIECSINITWLHLSFFLFSYKKFCGFALKIAVNQEAVRLRQSMGSIVASADENRFLLLLKLIHIALLLRCACSPTRWSHFFHLFFFYRGLVNAIYALPTLKHSI